MLVKKLNRTYVIPGVDKKIPSVTEIIKQGGSIVLTDDVKKAMHKGTVVHSQVESLVPEYFTNTQKNELDCLKDTSLILKQMERVLFEELNIRKESIKDFSFMQEQSFYHENNGLPYVGTADLVVRDPLGTSYVFDYKTGKGRSDSNKMQITAYANYFNARRCFLIFDNGFTEVDVPINTDLWNNEVHKYYNRSDEIVTIEEKKQYYDVEKDGDLLELMWGLKHVKTEQDKLSIEEKALKEEIANILEDKNVKHDEFSFYHTKGSVTRVFESDFQKWLLLKHSDRVVEKKTEPNLIFKIKR